MDESRHHAVIMEDIKGIIRYDASSTEDPVSTAWSSASVDDCDDEDISLLVPYLAIAAADDPEDTKYVIHTYASSDE